MNISERDLFDFIFYPENLSVEKAEYLKTSRIFEDEIEFSRSVKKSLMEELSEEVKLKIAEKIHIYNPAKIHTLYPVQETSKKVRSSIPVFAAASQKEKPAISAKTFIDEANHYLIRLLNFKSSSKIFVFSTTNEILKNYRVIIQPSGQIFSQADNSTPLEINSPIEADKIELQFI